MREKFLRVAFAMIVGIFVSAAAFAQTSTLSGTVSDPQGALIPGASVVAKNMATGTTYDATTNEQGSFTIPAVAIGKYNVTATLMGFKTAVIPDVVVSTNGPTTVTIRLEVGAVEETVTVKGGAEVVQTQATTVATTLNATQLTQLPLVSRDAMNMITFLPGVDTTGTNRASTIAGLPTGAINITIDGVNTQDNNNRTTDGFFSLISPRLDSVEEVTVTTAAQEASTAGQGAVQIRFTTRSGTNRYTGSGYYYLRDPKFNSNYWFNNRDKTPDPATGKAPKDQVKLYQPGFRVGGPIQIPGLYNGRDKAFFFVNYEQFRQPNPVTRTRVVANPLALNGTFQYTTSGAVTAINVLDVASKNGQTSSIDPTMGKLLADIQAATGKTGSLVQQTDPNLQNYIWTVDSKQLRHYPTWRLDYNVSNNTRVSYSSSLQLYDSFPDTLNGADPVFPGFPNEGGQKSTRLTWSAQGRTTLNKNIVNQAVVGYTASTVKFFPEVSVADFSGPVANQQGFRLIPGFGLSEPTAANAPQSRENPTIQVEDTLTWLKGSHSMTFGGSFTHIGLWAKNQTPIASVSFGIATGDPADAMFNTTNFPGASTANLTNARALYAMLTGRVTSIAANALLDEDTGKYVYLGPSIQRGQQHEYSAYAQDSWRARKNLTLNYGIRYELQMPFVSRNGSYSFATQEDIWGISGVGNLFMPGTLTGVVPTFKNLSADTAPYETDYNNFAPSLGLTYRPTSDNAMFKKILGNDGDTVLRAAYSLAYSRGGIADFSGPLGANQGRTLTATRNQNSGNLNPDGPLPVLLREQARLGAPAFADTPIYPIPASVNASINGFDPHLQVPYAESWTAGIQRAITRTTAFEARYVGTRHLQGLIAYNYNETNIVENHFLDEFKLAQQNLQANIAAGRGNTFAYAGSGTGTSPLPIYLAWLTGRTDATNLAAYQGTNAAQFTNTTRVNRLAIYNPSPTNAANDLQGDATLRANAATAGLPANFFIANPNVTSANLTGNGGYTRYDSMQLEVRRRMSKGLLLEANYTLAKQQGSVRPGLRVERYSGLSDGPHHAFKTNWVYELPFGRGRHYFSGVNSVMDRIIGGWEFDGNGRVQSGRILSFGNVRLVGMTDADLQKVYKIEERIDPISGRQLLFILPQDIIDNTIKAFSTSATSATGYGSLGAPSGRYFAPANGPDCIQVTSGDCAPQDHYVTGPKFIRFDLSAVKRIQLVGRSNFEFRAEFLNAFNNINFSPVANTGTSQTQNQISAGYRDVNGTQDPGGRLVQFVFRVSW